MSPPQSLRSELSAANQRLERRGDEEKLKVQLEEALQAAQWAREAQAKAEEAQAEAEAETHASHELLAAAGLKQVSVNRQKVAEAVADAEAAQSAQPAAKPAAADATTQTEGATDAPPATSATAAAAAAVPTTSVAAAAAGTHVEVQCVRAWASASPVGWLAPSEPGAACWPSSRPGSPLRMEQPAEGGGGSSSDMAAQCERPLDGALQLLPASAPSPTEAATAALQQRLAKRLSRQEGEGAVQAQVPSWLQFGEDVRAILQEFDEEQQRPSTNPRPGRRRSFIG